MNEEAIIRTVPAAEALHKVPGFDPLSHLRKEVTGNGDKVLSLALRYKRLWFRLAYPNGRLLLNPLRITDQMAIFEAQVFFQKEDPTPASSFTATKSTKETRGYIRAAQDEALNVALDNAGFGIQLCDVTKEPDTAAPSHDGPQPKTELAAQPAVRKQSEPAPAGKAAAVAAEKAADEPAPAVKSVPVPGTDAVTTPAPAPAVEQPVASVEPAAAQPQAAPEPERKEAVPAGPLEIVAAHTETAPQEAKKTAQNVIVNFPGVRDEQAGTTTSAESDGPAALAEPVQDAPAYTADMSVEEITARMTVDDAKGLTVDFGTCKGWTMGQVMENRPSSLKFFITPFCECGNVVKAAATLLLQELNQQKAS